MHRIASTLLLSTVLAAALAGPALAIDGASGGDREPAGGAFDTSYPEQGSTGIQRNGPPRSVDIPRYGAPYATGPVDPARPRRYRAN